MAEQFANAAYRHLKDSKVLLENQRWDGCAYLAGYVIECSLKALISSPSTPPGIELKELGHNLSALQACLDRMAASRQPAWKRHAPSSLLGALRSKLDTMQPPWEPAMRYASDNTAWRTEALGFWNLAHRCFGAFAKDLVTREVTP
ncbi:MAG TPA: hypothetical protein VKP30_08835 [Polyangiaceae bacterium]|nr:hypothetical protein [Polyangiaceae bacterium]